MRIFWALLLASLATLALAQVRIERLPQTAPQAPQIDRAVIDETATLRRDVQKLRTDLDNLRRQVEQLNSAFQGSALRCEGNASVSSTGRRDCGPFACDKATGQCISSCNTSNDCAAGNSCDTRCGRCGATPQCG